jgi:uncharacterized phiE125 gp8 family phage protein
VPITWTYITPPAAEPVTLTEAKLHLREDGTDQDSLIEGLITAAREYVESTGRLLMPCVVRQYFDEFPCRLSPLPIRSIASVNYLDSDGDSQTVTDYTADIVSEPARIQEPESGWPTTDDVINAVWVDINAGYTSAATVPRALKQAILLLVGHWYENREAIAGGAMTELPLAVETLMRRWAVYTQ